MPTGDPWCEIHGFMPCICNRFPAVPKSSSCNCFLIIEELKNRISILEERIKKLEIEE